MTTGESSGTSEFGEGDDFVVQVVESGSSVKFTQSQSGYTTHDEVPELSIEPNGHIGGNGTFEAGGFWMEVTSSTVPPNKEAEAKEKKAKEEAAAAKKATEEAEKVKYSGWEGAQTS
jgi:hypothetical protein